MTVSSRRKRVFVTGAAGNWGRKVLDEFRKRPEIDVIALVLPTPADLAVIRGYEDMVNLEVTFGDLTDYEAVESCVRGADFILHLGAVVSPYADEHPELARRVNVGAVENIIRAVHAQPDPGAIGVVGIGTVAEFGDRNPPHHWGRVGDPVRVARFDEYAGSKIIAERAMIESGLPKWVWLRQTGIFSAAMMGMRDPIMTHTPFEGVLEWVSDVDAARLVANICEPNVPEEFWCDIYNIGGGEGWRITNWELQTRMAAAAGVKDVKKWYERNWFATRNFHGLWYTDSDRLEELVPFRQDTFEVALARAVAATPSLKAGGRIPAWVIKNLMFKPITLKPRGMMAYVRDNDTEKINAYFGSREAWEQIGDWSTFWPPKPDRNPSFLDHGYDETKAQSEWGNADYAGVATHRGGELVSDATVGDVATPLSWRCSDGHEFTGSPRLILTAGHWCPECVANPAGYAEQAVSNRFLAQVE